ncbi:protein rogdi homolog [Sycon ciliatum]|uniref:protein rogdi homolog n=1 Tax=Sycon ciliatum TaxID=27933 RepID=UPI0020AC253C|eukprot:scpid62231/ scgid29628/ Protein rogdi homolog
MELNAQAQEREWLIKSQVPLTINQLKLCLERCLNLFKMNSKKDSKEETASSKPCKYVFSTPHQEVMKAIVAVDGHRIVYADISLRLPSAKSNSAPVLTSLRENAVWPLIQLRTSGQCVSRAINLLSDAAPAALLASSHAQSHGDAACMLMQQLEVLLSKAVDSLMIPDQWDLGEQARLNHQANLRPFVPDDTMIVFYIHCSRLVAAVYTIAPAPPQAGPRIPVDAPVRAYVGSTFDRGQQRHEVTAVNRIEVTMPWVAEVLCLLTTAQQLCQQLKEKITLMR